MLSIQLNNILTTISKRKSKQYYSWFKVSKMKTYIKKLANVSGKVIPIIVVVGDQAPIVQGENWYYIDANGNKVDENNPTNLHWSKLDYHKSTLRIEVGEKWLQENLGVSIVGDCICNICDQPIIDYLDLEKHGMKHLEEFNLAPLV